MRGFYTSGMPFTQYGSGPLVDPTDPKPGDRENVPSGSTLGEIARTLNARFGGSPRLLIDHALAAKSITVAGAEFAPALNVLEACAEVYGLRIAREEEGRTLRLTRRRIRRPANIAQLNETMRQVLPDPLLRALHRDDRDRARAEVREWAEKKRQDFFRRQAQASASGQSTNNSVPLPEPPPLTPEQAEREQERNQRVRQWQKAPTALRVAAIRRFRATVEPKVKAAPNQELPVADLDTAENAALATALMYSCLDGLKVVLARELPDYLTRFDELIITGGPTLNEDKEMKFGLGLALPLYGGKNLDIQVGVGNLPLPKK